MVWRWRENYCTTGWRFAPVSYAELILFPSSTSATDPNLPLCFEFDSFSIESISFQWLFMAKMFASLLPWALVGCVSVAEDYSHLSKQTIAQVVNRGWSRASKKDRSGSWTHDKKKWTSSARHALS
jgi:hypothetical protein